MYCCKRCHKPMRANRWGWFDHLVATLCQGQYAYWAEIE